MTRYWLRGGIVILISALIILPFEAIPSLKVAIYPFSTYITTPIGGLFFLPALFLMWGLLGDSPSNITYVFAYAVVFLFSIVWIFIIGAVIGWIYGKIKQNN